jgi:hypothetical protein
MIVVKMYVRAAYKEIIDRAEVHEDWELGREGDNPLSMYNDISIQKIFRDYKSLR